MDRHARTRRQFLFAGTAALASARLFHAGNADFTAPPKEPSGNAQARLSSDSDSDLASLTLNQWEPRTLIDGYWDYAGSLTNYILNNVCQSTSCN